MEPVTERGSEVRRSGLRLALLTAIVSGVSVFVNGYGVRAWVEISDPATYTTLKNAGAALILLTALIVAGKRAVSAPSSLTQIRENWPGLLAVAVIGGSIPFVLFFEGLSRVTSADGAFIHKTLVVWVAIMGVVILRERLGPLHILAIAFLVWGQATIAGGVGAPSFAGGELLILAATLMWAVETVVAKRLLRGVAPLTLGVSRMAGGTVLLVAYGLWRGAFAEIGAVTAPHLGWILLTALTLSAYVGTWYAALARAQAVDVTAVLVGGALITALLESGFAGVAAPPVLGVVLVAAGVGIFVLGRRRRPSTVR